MPKKDSAVPDIDLTKLNDIKRLERERFAKIDAGLLDHAIFLRPCRVKILMLVDTGISYNQFYFGLSEVLDTLRLNPEWWVKFDVTRAHRQTDPNKPAPGSAAEPLYAPHFEDFHFGQAGFNIDEYDEVWFYGFNSGTSTVGSPPPSLTPSELEILFAWMDRGGGVFATGDHATLGEALCSKIPRVRSMRKWAAADGVPPPGGATRHDTLLKGHDYVGTPAVDESTRYTFDDESDDIPMRIKPRWYHHHHCAHPHSHPHHWYWHYFHTHSPHPVLCGTDGVIDILPDHPHEGHVVEPAVLNATLTHGAYSAREYPDLSGSPLSPQIIAWATVQNDHTNANSFKGQANSKDFGAIGAYNGHCVDVGRVVVDSTWHHWFDVNLTGRMEFGTATPGSVETTDPRKLNGFNDTPAGKAALARIKNYFRNVALWLAPPAKQSCMVRRALWGSLFRYPLIEELHVRLPIWEIGHHAIDAIGRYAGQCNVRVWWPIIIRLIPLEKLFDPRRLTVPVEGLKMLDEFVIGGVVHAMLEAKEKEFPSGKLPDDKQLERLAEQGGTNGLKAFLAHVEESTKANQHIAEVFRAGLKEQTRG